MDKYVKTEFVSLKDHPTLNEKWVQERIAEDPRILGLGNLILRDKERMQPAAGRLDLLLQDQDCAKRYEVEVQLGKLDESHLIRTIEYWDIEKKRYPQYEHCAVIIAEDITSRFLNVLNLINNVIPLIAIQMKAIKVGDNFSLIFTTIFSEFKRGLEDEDEETKEVTDRHYWENHATKRTVKLVDDILNIIYKFSPDIKLKYNKFYIGLEKDGLVDNWVIFRPKKELLRVEIRYPQSETMDSWLEEKGFNCMDYDSRWNRYRIVFKTEQEIKGKEENLIELLRKSSEI